MPRRSVLCTKVFPIPASCCVLEQLRFIFFVPIFRQFHAPLTSSAGIENLTLSRIQVLQPTPNQCNFNVIFYILMTFEKSSVPQYLRPKTRALRQIAPESSSESSAKFLSQKFFGVRFLSLNLEILKVLLSEILLSLGRLLEMWEPLACRSAR